MPDLSKMSTVALIKRIERAPDFGYDDEAVELNRRLELDGKTWRWSGDFFRPTIEVVSAKPL